MAVKGGHDRLLVAAIDFGTTYSGYAFSFRHEYEHDPIKVSGHTWYAGANTPGASYKTSTTLLLAPDKSFHSFGYEAEDKYAELALETAHKDWYYFRRFKMLLFDAEGLTRNVELEDDKGERLPAKTVFALSIKYLKNTLLTSARDKVTKIMDSDIQWVLTVPAIWNDSAKQFMREAAEEAGIENCQLHIALEPEGASIYCRHLPVERTVGQYATSMAAFKAGTQYLVLDAGGGTADITVHQVTLLGSLKELHKATGGAWGGTNVDEAFRQLLIRILGSRVLTKFYQEHADDYLEMMREFETKKRVISPATEGKVHIRIPLALLTLYKKMNGKELSDAVAQSIFASSVSVRSDKMSIEAPVVKELFKDTTESIVKHLQNLLQMSDMTDTSAILMVGSFSESMMLQEAVRKAFPGMQLIIPREAGIAVLVGAVIFGHDPYCIIERKAKYTYGIGIAGPFIEGVHPEDKKFIGSFGDILCDHIFDVYIKEGTCVADIRAQAELTLTTQRDCQTKLFLYVYASVNKEPKFTTEPGCIKLGKISVPIPEPGPGKKHIKVRMLFGGTEIVVEGEDENGKVTQGIFDCLR